MILKRGIRRCTLLFSIKARTFVIPTPSIRLVLHIMASALVGGFPRKTYVSKQTVPTMTPLNLQITPTCMAGNVIMDKNSYPLTVSCRLQTVHMAFCRKTFFLGVGGSCTSLAECGRLVLNISNYCCEFARPNMPGVAAHRYWLGFAVQCKLFLGPWLARECSSTWFP